MRYLIGSLSVFFLFISSISTVQAQQFRQLFRNIQCESQTPFDLRFPAGTDLSSVTLSNQVSVRTSFGGENFTGDTLIASTNVNAWITVDLGGGLQLSLAPGSFTTDFINATEGTFYELYSRRFPPNISQAGGLNQLLEAGVGYPAVLHVDCSSTHQGSNSQLAVTTFVQALQIKITGAR